MRMMRSYNTYPNYKEDEAVFGASNDDDQAGLDFRRLHARSAEWFERLRYEITERKAIVSS